MWKVCNCPYNKNIVCQGKRPSECSSCGWCPQEANRRKAEIREKFIGKRKLWRYVING